jgi:hypothetical protein
VSAHGRAAREWCEQRFDIQHCAKAYARLFDESPRADPTGDQAGPPKEANTFRSRVGP